MPLTSEEEHLEFGLRIEQMTVQIDKGRLDIEKIRQDIDRDRLNIDKIRRDIDRDRLNIDKIRQGIELDRSNIDKTRQDIELDRKRFKIQVWGMVITAFSVVVGAFAAGGAWVHYTGR